MVRNLHSLTGFFFEFSRNFNSRKFQQTPNFVMRLCNFTRKIRFWLGKPPNNVRKRFMHWQVARLINLLLGLLLGLITQPFLKFVEPVQTTLPRSKTFLKVVFKYSTKPYTQIRRFISKPRLFDRLEHTGSPNCLPGWVKGIIATGIRNINERIVSSKWRMGSFGNP